MGRSDGELRIERTQRPTDTDLGDAIDLARGGCSGPGGWCVCVCAAGVGGVERLRTWSQLSRQQYQIILVWSRQAHEGDGRAEGEASRLRQEAASGRREGHGTVGPANVSGIKTCANGWRAARIKKEAAVTLLTVLDSSSYTSSYTVWSDLESDVGSGPPTCRLQDVGSPNQT